MAGAPKRRGPVRSRRPRQARSERTRRGILEAALELLAAGGPAAVTHRAVATRAGVSLGATTYHFASKYDLLDEVYRLHLTRVRERAQSILEAFGGDSRGAPASARDRLVAGLTRYLQEGVRRDRVGSLATFELALERARDPALRRRLRAAGDRSNAYAAQMLRALGSRTPEPDAELLVAVLAGLRLAWLAEGEGSAMARRVPAVLERVADLLPLET